MKRVISSLLLVVGVLSASSTDPKIKEGIRAINHFTKTVKERLVRKVKADSKGVKAINYCSDNAIKITKSVASMYKGVVLKRVSLQCRNTKNKPDKIDVAVLKEFKRLSKKRKKMNMKIITTKDSYRIYKPLAITTPLCLKCHGSQRRMHPDVIKILDKKYPDDKARNFRYRQVRGAVVAIVKK